MLYSKLSTLPMVLFAEINETGETQLLDTEFQEPYDANKALSLTDIWTRLKEEYDNKYNNRNGKKQFNLIKDIEFTKHKYIVIKMCIEALKFDIDNDVIEILKSYNYKIDLNNYNADLLRIGEESENILIKLTELQNKLPKKDENDTTSARDNVLNSLSAYSSILGFDIDYYTVSVEKYFLLNDRATEKLKQPKVL